MKPTVLIIDDDAAIRQQLFWLLCDDYEVMTASDLASAIRRATIYEPAVSILDLHLPPTLDSPAVGFKILEYIKARFPASKVFVISSATDTDTQRECFDGGADGFLNKPIDIEQLISTVRRSTLASRLEAV